MVEPEDFTVELSEGNGRQLIVAKTSFEGQSTELLYSRPKGEDTWFSYVGKGGSRVGESVSLDLPSEIRQTADEAVLEQGYPLRTFEGTKSETGQIHQFFEHGSEIYPFITYSETIYVYTSDSGAKPANEPQPNEVYIEIVDEDVYEVTVNVDSGGSKPPEYAVEEAVLFRYSLLEPNHHPITVKINWN